MAKHPHYEVMMEWAADTSKVVQYEETPNNWLDVSHPEWSPNAKYRIKPEKKPDVVAYAHIVKSSNEEGWGYRCSASKTIDPNIRLTFDGETGKLIKTEVLHAE